MTEMASACVAEHSSAHASALAHLLVPLDRPTRAGARTKAVAAEPGLETLGAGREEASTGSARWRALLLAE